MQITTLKIYGKSQQKVEIKLKINVKQNLITEARMGKGCTAGEEKSHNLY